MVRFCYSARQTLWDPEMLAESTVKKVEINKRKSKIFFKLFYRFPDGYVVAGCTTCHGFGRSDDI